MIPQGSIVLVTGANSWQGIHICDQLLEHGYRVRGAVRDEHKADWTSTLFEGKYGSRRYDTTIVPDMTVRGGYDAAVTG